MAVSAQRGVSIDPNPTIDHVAAIGFIGTDDAALGQVDPADQLTEIQNVRVYLSQPASPERAGAYLEQPQLARGWHQVAGTPPVGDDATLQEGARPPPAAGRTR